MKNQNLFTLSRELHHAANQDRHLKQNRLDNLLRLVVCVVLTVATEGAGAPAAAAIFATSAKSGAIAAASSALIGGTAAGVITGIETEDFD